MQLPAKKHLDTDKTQYPAKAVCVLNWILLMAWLNRIECVYMPSHIAYAISIAYKRVDPRILVRNFPALYRTDILCCLVPSTANPTLVPSPYLPASEDKQQPAYLHGRGHGSGGPTGSTQVGREALITIIAV